MANAIDPFLAQSDQQAMSFGGEELPPDLAMRYDTENFGIGTGSVSTRPVNRTMRPAPGPQRDYSLPLGTPRPASNTTTGYTAPTGGYNQQNLTNEAVSQILTYGESQYAPTGVSANYTERGGSKVKMSELPEYWRGVLNYGLTPEQSAQKIKSAYGGLAGGTYDETSAKEYPASSRNLLRLPQSQAAFLSAAGVVPERYLLSSRPVEQEPTIGANRRPQVSLQEYEKFTRWGQLSPEQKAAERDWATSQGGQFVEPRLPGPVNIGTDVTPGRTFKRMVEVVDQNDNTFYADAETGRKLDVSSMDFDTALRYGVASQGGGKNIFETDPVFLNRSSGGFFTDIFSGLMNFISYAGIVATAGAASLAHASLWPAAGQAALKVGGTYAGVTGNKELGQAVSAAGALWGLGSMGTSLASGRMPSALQIASTGANIASQTGGRR